MTPVSDQDAIHAAREAALGLLDRGDHATERLVEKLGAAGFAEAASRTAVARLAREGWLDEEALARRLAEAITRRQPAAPEFVESKLRARRINPEVAARVARETAGSEELIEFVVRWARQRSRAAAKATPAAAARRVAAALQRRGFDDDTVATVLERLSLATPHEMPDDAG